MKTVTQPPHTRAPHGGTPPVDPRLPRHDPDGAVDRLLDAAEMLVAKQGLGVTDRAIVAASGHRNNSAITYHFGNRQGLLDAVWQRRTARVERRRAAFLLAAGTDLRQVDLRTAVTCYVTAFTDELASLTPSYWARFNERTLQERPLNFVDWVTVDLERFSGTVPLHSLLALFGRMRELTGYGVEPVAGNRVALTVRFVITTLAAWERDSEAGHSSWRNLDELGSDLIEMAMSILDTPEKLS
ncbi:MAG: hypothetical protein ABWX96_11030 [Propionibacteriaceae bacterium]